MYWIIWVGNAGQFPYYLGIKRALACCVEDAKWYTTEAEAQHDIDTACEQWRRNWPHARPVRVDPPIGSVMAEAMGEIRVRVAEQP